MRGRVEMSKILWVLCGSLTLPVALLAEEEKPADESVRRDEVVVVSASKMDSSLVNAPATMSVVGQAVIEASPAQNYGDLLRAVPGLNVIQTSARDFNMTSRQSSGTLANT